MAIFLKFITFVAFIAILFFVAGIIGRLITRKCKNLTAFILGEKNFGKLK